MNGQQMTGAQALVESLKHAGAEVVFGLPGGAILPTYDPLMDAEGLRHVLVRHEQGAGHAAERLCCAPPGKVGVCLATSGPGATNLITAIADAQMDSVPWSPSPARSSSKLHRHRRLPGGGHRRNDDAGHQAQLPRHQRRGHPIGDPQAGLPHRVHRPARRRSSWTSPRTHSRRCPRSCGPETLQLPGYRPILKPAREADPRGREAHLEAQAPRVPTRWRSARVRGRQGSAQNSPKRPIRATTLMARGAFPDSHQHPSRNAGYARQRARGVRVPEAGPHHHHRCTIR